MKKSIKFMLLFILLLFILLILTACGSKYSTKLDWIDEGTDAYIQSIKIAVESDNYSGKNLKEGTYIVRQTNSGSNETVEKVYNVFVSDKEYNNIDNVPIEDLQGTVGGYGNKDEIEITVKKGQYVYLQTNNNGYSGYLEMKLKK